MFLHRGPKNIYAVIRSKTNSEDKRIISFPNNPQTLAKFLGKYRPDSNITWQEK